MEKVEETIESTVTSTSISNGNGKPILCTEIDSKKERERETGRSKQVS